MLPFVVIFELWVPSVHTNLMHKVSVVNGVFMTIAPSNGVFMTIAPTNGVFMIIAPTNGVFMTMFLPTMVSQIRVG
jgi:hypothetical protein